MSHEFEIWTFKDTYKIQPKIKLLFMTPLGNSVTRVCYHPNRCSTCNRPSRFTANNCKTSPTSFWYWSNSSRRVGMCGNLRCNIFGTIALALIWCVTFYLPDIFCSIFFTCARQNCICVCVYHDGVFWTADINKVVIVHINKIKKYSSPPAPGYFFLIFSFTIINISLV